MIVYRKTSHRRKFYTTKPKSQWTNKRNGNVKKEQKHRPIKREGNITKGYPY
jgi:hypothetical protein